MCANKNQFCESFLEKVNFDIDHHLKPKADKNYSKKELKKQTAVKKLVNKTETKVITNWLFYHFQITEERICASQMQSYLVS